MKIHEERKSVRKIIFHLALYCAVTLFCLTWFAGNSEAQRSPQPEKKQPLSEMDKLLQEKKDVKTARFKLLQDESAYQVKYYKPVDRLRRQFDLQEHDLYAECSDGKDLKNPQYSFCAAELKRFNDNVRYYNERLDALKSGLIGHKQEFNAKMDDLDRKEQDVDRRINALKEKRLR